MTRKRFRNALNTKKHPRIDKFSSAIGNGSRIIVQLLDSNNHVLSRKVILSPVGDLQPLKIAHKYRKCFVTGAERPWSATPNNSRLPRAPYLQER